MLVAPMTSKWSGKLLYAEWLGEASKARFQWYCVWQTLVNSGTLERGEEVFKSGRVVCNQQIDLPLYLNFFQFLLFNASLGYLSSFFQPTLQPIRIRH